jgi:hypothetical protein
VEEGGHSSSLDSSDSFFLKAGKKSKVWVEDGEFVHKKTEFFPAVKFLLFLVLNSA